MEIPIQNVPHGFLAEIPDLVDDFFGPNPSNPCAFSHPSIHVPTPQMDKSKKEEAKLEAEETFWEGPPSGTEAHIGKFSGFTRHGPPSEWEE